MSDEIDSAAEQPPKTGVPTKGNEDMSEKIELGNMAVNLAAAGKVKPWDDLSDAEKIEVLRTTVMDLQRSLGWAQERAYRAEAMVEGHEHSREGKALFTRHALSWGMAQGAQAWNPLA